MHCFIVIFILKAFYCRQIESYCNFISCHCSKMILINQSSYFVYKGVLEKFSLINVVLTLMFALCCILHSCDKKTAANSISDIKFGMISSHESHLI